MKRMIVSRFVVLLFGLACIGAVRTAGAQDADPSSRVARLSYLQGDVSMQPGDADSWVDAQLNRPLTTEDKLWVDRSSRAELQLGSAAIQLDQGSGVSFLELSDDVVQMRLTEGVANVRVKRLRNEETFEIDTPNAAVSLLEPGTYRVEVNEAGDTTAVQVRSGRAEVNGDRQSFTVDSKEAAEFRGTDRLAASFSSVGPEDDFDAWAANRNQRAERAASTRYVSADVVGYEDLDAYGDWRYDPDYGYVWYPVRISSGWAPYRYGHWVWVAPWGWTWVDDAPWGFAPFHYGRWAYRTSRWCWIPGPIGIRPVYAPALVAWVGRPGVGITVSVGSVGWFPLGPREVYVPAYRSSRTYVHNVNISNTTVNNTYVNNVYERRTVNNNYMNRNAPRALSVVEQETFTRGRPVANHMVRMNERALRELPAASTAPEIKPTRESALGAGRVRAAPTANLSRPVMALREPARLRNEQATGPSDKRRDQNERALINVVRSPTSTRDRAADSRTGAGVPQPNAATPVQRNDGQGIREREADPAARSDRPSSRRYATDDAQRNSPAAPVAKETPNNQSMLPNRTDARENARADRPAQATLPQARPSAPPAQLNNEAATESRVLRQSEARQREDRATPSPRVREDRAPQERRNVPVQSAPMESKPTPPAPQAAEAPRNAEPRSAPAPQAEARQAEQQRRRGRDKEEDKR